MALVKMLDDDIRSTSVMFNAKPSGSTDTDFLLNQDFRQITLIKNPKKSITILTLRI